MNINQKLEALGFDPSNHDAAVHSALDELAERAGIDFGQPKRDPATLAKGWWTHVKECDACTLPRPGAHCTEGHLIYNVMRGYRPTRPGSVQVQHKDLLIRSAQ